MAVKHILHITFNMNIGGTEQVIRSLIEGLDENKFQSSVLCIDGDIGPWGQELEKKGITHYKLTRQPGFDVRLIREIRKLIKAQKIDIVHGHQYTPYIYALFAAFLLKPVIFTEHGRFYPDSSTWKRKLLNPILQRSTAGITAISAATKQALSIHENFSNTAIDVIYNGIDDRYQTIPNEKVNELKDRLKLDNNVVVFGTIARLDPIKNQAMMIRAFAAARQARPHIKLLIVGDGPEKQALKNLTCSLELDNAVIFTGFQTSPLPYLVLMDIFLLPSLSEGTSMTLLEAMSFSKPTIATAVGGTPEIIADGETGLLIENKDEKALTKAIEALAKDKDCREKLGHAARSTFLKKYHLNVMVENYSELYQQLTD